METFLFVHGGMIGGNCWNHVVSSLRKKGHLAIAPSLTGLGDRTHLSHPGIDLDTHIQDIVNTIFYEELDEIILVGHSYGGMVITGVLDRIPKQIKKLIYIGAAIPQSGESLFDALGTEIATFLENSTLKNGWQVPAGAPEMYGIESQEICDWFIKMTSPQPINTFRQKLFFNMALFQKVEKLYIHSKKDEALEFLYLRAKEMSIPCTLLDSGHLPMLTAIEPLVDLLLRK